MDLAPTALHDKGGCHRTDPATVQSGISQYICGKKPGLVWIAGTGGIHHLHRDGGDSFGPAHLMKHTALCSPRDDDNRNRFNNLLFTKMQECPVPGLGCPVLCFALIPEERAMQ